jgi:hypothetical protein
MMPALSESPPESEKAHRCEDERHRLRFSKANAQVSQRRRRSQEQKKATVRSVKHHFPAGMLPVRGLFQVACMVIGLTAVTNVRRIQRYLEGKNQQKSTPITSSDGQNGASAQDTNAIFVRVWVWCERVVGLPSTTRSILAC